MGLAIKRLDIARHDAKSVALVFLPIVGCVAAFMCAVFEVASRVQETRGLWAFWAFKVSSGTPH